MKKFLFVFTMVSSIMQAQITADFEELNPGPESVWNGSDGSADGFSSGNLWFPTVWDTSWGGFWASGFAISTITDTLDKSFVNMYSSVTGTGYNGSETYIVAQAPSWFKLTGPAAHKQLLGAYITNSTYVAATIKNGNEFSKPFGGTSGNDPDYFRVIFKGYNQGEATSELTFYLADYRFGNNDEDFIVKDWTWVDLSALGNVDSVFCAFESTDVFGEYINTPTYFCLDNIITADSSTAISAPATSIPEVFPNPAVSNVKVRLKDNAPSRIYLYSADGRLMQSIKATSREVEIDVQNLVPGIYILQVEQLGHFNTKTIQVQ